MDGVLSPSRDTVRCLLAPLYLPPQKEGTVTIVLSFDIDGTLEVGDPPGGVTMEMVRRAHELGYVIGSCSDRPLSGQQAIWERVGIPVAFTAAKHQLPDVRAQFIADIYYHIGDRDLDRQLAEQAGFRFWWDHEAVTEPWLLVGETRSQ